MAGHTHKSGYVYISINNKRYLSQRIAVLYMTGKWPKEQVDHKKGIRDDNRWKN